jgi:hypothetical protein
MILVNITSKSHKNNPSLYIIIEYLTIVTTSTFLAYTITGHPAFYFSAYNSISLFPKNIITRIQKKNLGCQNIFISNFTHSTQLSPSVGPHILFFGPPCFPPQ